MLPLGKLRHRIAIEQRTLTRNAYGEEVETWGVLFQAWAQVRALRGNELFKAQQVQSSCTHEVLMRYRPGLDATMRVNFRGQILNILGLPPDEKNESLRLLCVEPAPTP